MIADKISIQAASEGVPIVPVYPGVIYGTGKVTSGNIVAKMVLIILPFLLSSFFCCSNRMIDVVET